MAGLRALSASAALELIPHGIRVRTIQNSADVVAAVMTMMEAQ
jgi:NAD(P)-dependent dehydrogenase (short-subunit alcohol dehydrogenase family)